MKRALVFLCLLALLLSTPVAAQERGGLAGLFGGGGNSGGLLPPEEAFPFSAELVAEDVIVARWDTVEGYYLYRDRFDFELQDSDNDIAGFELPEGHVVDDPNFGRMEVYYEPVEVYLRLDKPAGESLTLTAHYQGCNEDTGVCYPPLSSDFSLAGGVSDAGIGAGAGGGGPPAAGGGDPLSQLLSGGNLWLILGGFFVAGLLLAFTACMYPLIPILSGLIAGEGERRSATRGFWLSLVFIQATAITYAIAGAAAGMTGAAIQADLQSPWVLGSFAAVFVLLALAMFGLYDLRMPAGIQTRLDAMSRRQRGGSFLGAGVMGILSALIVGACSGPALIAALVFISNTGDALVGGLALFAMGNGMGLPLLVVGTALGRWLPRSGLWMVRIKQLFGVVFLAVALWMVDRFLPGPITLGLWAVLLVGVAVWLGVLDRSDGDAGLLRRGQQFAGVLLVIWSIALLLGAAAGGSRFWQPLQPLTQGAPASSEQQKAGWEDVDSLGELEAAISEAGARGQATVVDFYADWCVYCVQLEERTFPDPDVVAALADKQLLRVDVTAMNDDHRELLQTLDVFLPPAVLFYDTDGNEHREQRVVGFLSPDDFVDRTRNAYGNSQP
ncbi:protein-disulfide reductase DsbD [Aquisalimonas sp. 2447]|uniref:protein-disulfide reductase DsbD n=1 Tax=Aquisalimonas sp. 2447 TaxID=2740807 RepID=UPI001432531E|nr:protein-disulfide reductase DsbD [Aquisalimonas sp. 2447]QIT56880.1 protein-disulfide reductase DsbD [Aquisalimonas sp. 2447]